MYEGKMKAVTFSYDDGIAQDIRLVELFNRYGLKATFNINSGQFGMSGIQPVRGTPVPWRRLNAEEIAHAYSGHEVAVHTLTHPNLTMLDENEVIRQVEQDRVTLSKLVGYEVLGMAYPCGGVNNDDRVAEIIRKNTGVKYARTTTSTNSFDLQDNLYRFNPSVYHLDKDNVEALVKRFIDLKTDKPAVLYIWGHSYEFDRQNDWIWFEDICKDLGNREDIFYGTNREILLHSQSSI